MEGGEISGNSTTATSNNSNAGVTVSDGILKMSGGSITGNMHDTVPADVYLAITAATPVNRLSLSGNATVGAVKLNASNTSNYSRVSIGAGFIGNITALNLLVTNADLPTGIGWWNGKDIINGSDAHTITTTDIQKINLGDFITNLNNSLQGVNVTHEIIYDINDPRGSLGKLVEKQIPPVRVDVGATTTHYWTLPSAFNQILPTQTATVTILGDGLTISGLGATGINIVDKTVTIRPGGGSNREILLGNNGRLFSLGTDGKLTLEGSGGRTLTLRGQGAGVENIQTLIYVASDGELILNEGAILSDNVRSAGHAGGVYVFGGKFVMNGGEIRDNTTIRVGTAGGSGGAVGVEVGGEFIMKGGLIEGNQAIGDSGGGGGGVYITGESTMEMIDGIIQGNSTTAIGGGVYLWSGDFTMSGGRIGGDTTETTNTANSMGGGVYIQNGSIELSGTAEISGNTANIGGGLLLSPGVALTMNGASIKNNIATVSGGGVQINSATFSMNNGIIENNAALNGGGVYINTGATFSMGGGARVTVSSTNNDIYLLTGQTVNITANFSGADLVGRIREPIPTDNIITLFTGTGTLVQDNYLRFQIYGTGYGSGEEPPIPPFPP